MKRTNMTYWVSTRYGSVRHLTRWYQVNLKMFKQPHVGELIVRGLAANWLGVPYNDVEVIYMPGWSSRYFFRWQKLLD